MLDRVFSATAPMVLTDGGIETTLIFDEGEDLPHFAAFHLLRNEAGRRVLERYYERYLDIAEAFRTGFILESPTWRSSPDWGDLLGYSKVELARANRAAIELMLTLRHRRLPTNRAIVVSGCVGPRGDGYVAGELMRAEVAEAYHAEQISVMADAGADIISAITMTNAAEAIGIVRAARRAGRPSVISFTVETDGRLPTGQSIADAIAEVDAATEGGPFHYMINCAHPTHFTDRLRSGAGWLGRIGGVRANASCKSHEELNESAELDRGDPEDLARLYRDLRARLPRLKVLGGCCGTDHTHISAIARACV